MTARAYYNEIDPFAAAWLRELIAAKLIATGDVDERSIVDVSADDVRGYTQCHFFVGIGGWSYALRLAGWPDDRPIWTGSCPCQPFSAAGKGDGFTDARHLWPSWVRLIRECRPVVVAGEQVESAVAHGWLDLVFDDLEGEGYACGAVALPAASVGAPHLRQRVWFVADSTSARWQQSRGTSRASFSPEVTAQLGRHGTPIRTSELGDTNERRRWVCGEQESRGIESACRPELDGPGARGPITEAWADLIWLPCRDGKARPTQPGLQPLAHGVSGRVGRLRGYGNAIVPQVAAEVIRAYLEVAHG